MQEIIRLGKKEVLNLIESHSSSRQTLIISWEEQSPIVSGKDVVSIEKCLLETSINNVLHCRERNKSYVFVVEDKEITYLMRNIIQDVAPNINPIIVEAGSYDEVLQRAREITSIKELLGFIDVIAIVDGDVEEEILKMYSDIKLAKLPIKSIRKEFFSLILEGKIELTEIFRLLDIDTSDKIKQKIIQNFEYTNLNSKSLKKLWDSTIKEIRDAIKFKGQTFSKRNEEIEIEIISFIFKRELEKFRIFSKNLKQLIEN